MKIFHWGERDGKVGTAQVEWIGDKVGEARLRWLGAHDLLWQPLKRRIIQEGVVTA